MGNMNKKRYWKTRKRAQSIIFRIKALLYSIVNKIGNLFEYRSFRSMIIRSIIRCLIKTTIIALGVLLLDNWFIGLFKDYGVNNVLTIDIGIYVDVIIGSIGVAGVILGLYCSNIASIYSSRYANAPEKLSLAFQCDRLTQKCMFSIISFIIYGFTVIVESFLKLIIGWISIITIIIWAIYVVVSYSIAGNRTYQLSDVYRLADDSYNSLIKIIRNRLPKKLFSSDVNFQYYYSNEAWKKIDLLKSIQKYGVSENSGDNTTMVEFIFRNILLVGEYWKIKKGISKSSLWYRNKTKYQKWHLSNITETEMALRTGTLLGAKNERDYWWFENEIMSINHSCYEVLLKKNDYGSFCSCLHALDKLCMTAISCKEIIYYVEEVNWLKKIVINNIPSELDNLEKQKDYSRAVESISLLYLNIILESTKLYSEFNINDITKSIVKTIDKGNKVDKEPLLSGRSSRDFYEKIITEICVEGFRITPTWVINQFVAKEEYDYLNVLIDSICDGIGQTFSLGKEYLENKLFFESCILLSKFYEFESQLKRFIDVFVKIEKDLRVFQIDKEWEWDDFRLEKSMRVIEDWKKEIPKLLLNSSSKFALTNWENRGDFPDFLGESFNHICEDAVDSIVNNNIIQFEIDFFNLSKLMLLYQEYIRTDFIAEDNKYRADYVFYSFTAPIVEWAQIGGLAILWGEFKADISWYEKVNEGSKSILIQNNNEAGLAEKLILYAQNREKYMVGIGIRDYFETNWNIRVANAIKSSGSYDVIFEMYGPRLKTNSKLLNAFCSGFVNFGFLNDPSEVFFIKCINPLLPKEKRYHTRYSWEEKLDE